MADWTTQAADAIEAAVSAVRQRAVLPAQRATRAIVYGLLVTFFVLTALVLLAVGAFRGVVVLSGDVWLAYLIVGGMLVLGGTFCWSKRSRKVRPPTTESPG
jgi:hypothetical protein